MGLGSIGCLALAAVLALWADWEFDEKDGATPAIPVIVATGLWSIEADPALTSHLRFTYVPSARRQLLVESFGTSVAPLPEFLVLSHVMDCVDRSGGLLSPTWTVTPDSVASVVPSAATLHLTWPAAVEASDVGAISFYAASPSGSRPGAGLTADRMPLRCALDAGAFDSSFQTRRLRFFHQLAYAGNPVTETALNRTGRHLFHISKTDDYILQGDVENPRVDFQFGTLEASKQSFALNALNFATALQDAKGAPVDEAASSSLVRESYGADLQWDDSRLIRRHELIFFLAAGLLGLALTMILELVRRYLELRGRAADAI